MGKHGHIGFVTQARERRRSERLERCEEKLEKDVAFVNVFAAEKQMRMLNVAMKYDLVDQISLLGGCF